MAEAVMDTQTRQDRYSMAGRTFRLDDVPAVRRFAAEFGARAGIRSARLPDFVLAVSEAAACAVARGPCTASLRLWSTGQRVLCETRGDSRSGVGQDGAEALRRRLLHQLCDYASVRSGHGGVTVVLSMAVT